MAGATLVTLGIAGAGFLLTAGRTRWRSVSAAVAVVALAVTVGANLVRTLAYRPEIPRTGAMTCRTAADLTMCAWPEHADLLDEAVPVIVSVAEALRAADLPVPSTVTEQWEVPDSVTITLTADDLRSGAVSLRRAVALSAHPGFDPPVCADDQGWPSSVLAVYLMLWLEEIVGVDGTSHATADVQAALARLQQRPREAQRTWFDRAAAALKTCDEPDPELLP